MVYTVPSAFSLSLFSCLAYKCLRVALRNSAVPYNTFAALVSITFARSVRLQSYLHPLTSTSSWFLFVRTLSASSILVIRVFPVFFPHTQTGYECVFLFIACLSFTVARTPEHQCLLLSLFCLLAQRRSGASPILLIHCSILHYERIATIRLPYVMESAMKRTKW